MVLIKYLNHNKDNYLVEFKYRNLLIQCLEKLPTITYFKAIRVILENGLRLGLITEKNAKQNVELNFILSNHLKYLLDSSFTPIITDLNSHNFILFSTNKNLGNVMVEKANEFMNLIPKIRSQEICTIIVNWNQPYKKPFSSLFESLLRQLAFTKDRI